MLEVVVAHMLFTIVMHTALLSSK